MFDANGQSGLLYFVQAGRSEEFTELALARPCKLRLTPDFGRELAGRLPKQAQRSLVAGVIPNACRHDTIFPRDARHLSKSYDGTCHEVHDQLRHGGVERSILERQLFRRSSLHTDSGVSLPDRRNETL
jgi:hypothetical protein